ncbi:unnamed protein product [Symbiodinium sp. CCMP2592]|nr:unnamed protein product [Symbiodinium sp. CCMP2592]
MRIYGSRLKQALGVSWFSVAVAMAAGLPSWSAWARPPSTPSPRRGHPSQAGLTPAPTSPLRPAEASRQSRRVQETGLSADAFCDRHTRKVCQSPPVERIRRRLSTENTRSPKTPQSSKVPWRPSGNPGPQRSASCSDASRRGKAAAQQQDRASRVRRPTSQCKYVVTDADAGDEETKMKLLQAENRSLRALAGRLQTQLAAVKESTLTYQTAAEELQGEWEDDVEEDTVDRSMRRENYHASVECIGMFRRLQIFITKCGDQHHD